MGVEKKGNKKKNITILSQAFLKLALYTLHSPAFKSMLLTSVKIRKPSSSSLRMSRENSKIRSMCSLPRF